MRHMQRSHVKQISALLVSLAYIGAEAVLAARHESKPSLRLLQDSTAGKQGQINIYDASYDLRLALAEALDIELHPHLRSTADVVSAGDDIVGLPGKCILYRQ